MKLELDYRELDLIRELVSARREKMIQDFGKIHWKKLPLKKVQHFVGIVKANRNPWCVEGVCGAVLDKIETIENEIQKATKQRRP